MSSEELGIRVSAFFTEFLLGCGIMMIEWSVSSLRSLAYGKNLKLQLQDLAQELRRPSLWTS